MRKHNFLLHSSIFFSALISLLPVGQGSEEAANTPQEITSFAHQVFEIDEMLDLIFSHVNDLKTCIDVAQVNKKSKKAVDRLSAMHFFEMLEFSTSLPIPPIRGKGTLAILNNSPNISPIWISKNTELLKTYASFDISGRNVELLFSENEKKNPAHININGTVAGMGIDGTLTLKGDTHFTSSSTLLAHLDKDGYHNRMHVEGDVYFGADITIVVNMQGNITDYLPINRSCTILSWLGSYIWDGPNQNIPYPNIAHPNIKILAPAGLVVTSQINTDWKCIILKIHN